MAGGEAPIEGSVGSDDAVIEFTLTLAIYEFTAEAFALTGRSLEGDNPARKTSEE